MEEIQNNLGMYDKTLKFENNLLLPLKLDKRALEREKLNLIDFSSSFIESINLEENQYVGRPRAHLKDIIKSLIIMSYNNLSYRRTQSDLEILKEKGLIQNIPKKSTLNKYMMSKKVKKIIEKLIQMSSLFFLEHEDTLIVDSTWLSTRMYVGGHKKVYNKRYLTGDKCRKLNIACCKNSRIITCAITAGGLKHESPFFKELVSTTIKNGFVINKILADKGYSSKENYSFSESLNIKNIFIDFKSNANLRRAKSAAWRKQLELFKENPEKWHESYRFRPVVETVFSEIKRKNVNYLRARTEISQDVELLLKCLCYNFTVISRFFN